MVYYGGILVKFAVKLKNDDQLEHRTLIMFLVGHIDTFQDARWGGEADIEGKYFGL